MNILRRLIRWNWLPAETLYVRTLPIFIVWETRPGYSSMRGSLSLLDITVMKHLFIRTLCLFNVLAIFVACLGLLGLSSFVVKLRTKEIGIRKVLGATLYSLLILFTRDFVKLVCIATVIAIPVIYFMASRWLNNYAFHIHLSWLIFVIPPLLLLAISLITISLQSIKAAMANPVKSLKTD